MARMVGRSRTGNVPVSTSPAPPSRTNSTPTSPATSPTMDSDDASSTHSSISTTDYKFNTSIRVVGRGGMMRTGSGPQATFTPTLNHSAAMGRGHSQLQSLQQSYHPFLDRTYMIPKATVDGSGSGMIASHMSMESIASRTPSANETTLRLENLQIFLHENGETKPIAQKTLGFDVRQTVKNVMHEICTYLEVENVRPLYMHCKNTNSRLDDGTLATNKIETDFMFDFHVTNDISLVRNSDDSLHDSTTFVDRLNPNTVYLTLLIFNTQRQLLVSGAGLLPTVELTSETAIVDDFNKDSKEFVWLRAKAVDYEMPALEAINQGAEEDYVFTAEALEQSRCAVEQIVAGAIPSKSGSFAMKSLKFRAAFFRACATFQKEFQLNRLGSVYHAPISVKAVSGAKLIVAVQFNSHALDLDAIKAAGMRWKSPRNLQPNLFNLEDSTLWALYLQYYQRQRQTLAPGVYVGLFRIKTTTDSLDVLTLKHDPDLIPLIRIRSGSTPDGFEGQFSSRLSINDRSRTSQELLTVTEISYLKYLADKERNVATPPPADVTITRELELLGTNVRAAIKVLGSQIGVSDLDLKKLSAINPVTLRKDIMILILSAADDLQTGKSEKPAQEKGGFFNKLKNLGNSKTKEEGGHQESDINTNMFQYLPLALFEVLHHSNYNAHNYTSYRHTMEAFNLDQLRIELMDEKKLSIMTEKAIKSVLSNKDSIHATSPTGAPPAGAGPMQNLLAAMNEKKKQWNANQSWALRIIQHNREQMMQHRMDH